MSGISIRPHFDANGKDFAIEQFQDCEPFLEANQADRREEQHSDWGRKVCSIPPIIAVKWLNDEHARGNTSLRMFSKEWDELVWRKINDPEWSYLRTDRPALQVGW